MSAIETWHNTCCLALLDIPEDGRPAHWECPDCGADWQFDHRFNAHLPGTGAYWETHRRDGNTPLPSVRESLEDITNLLARLARAVEDARPNDRQPAPFVVLPHPAPSLWQRIKRLIKGSK